MTERSFDEMIAYFNRRVSEMDIAQDYKMELLGMVTALGYKHEKSAQQWISCSSTKRPKDREEVMVTIDDGYHRYTDMDEYVNGRYWYHDNKQVVAWKPFDEPWKGEQE